MLGGICGLFAAVTAVRRRFRGATGLERLQLKWLAYSSFLIPATLLVCLAFALAGEGIDQEGTFTVLVLLMLAAVPASVGIAILRYRLYDIDRLVNRTLVYGVLTVLLAGTYGGRGAADASVLPVVGDRIAPRSAQARRHRPRSVRPRPPAVLRFVRQLFLVRRGAGARPSREQTPAFPCELRSRRSVARVLSRPVES
jgi:hypothetical protein